MDKTDKLILNILQKNADTTIQDISKLVHLSSTPCWQRINKLKKEGFIKKTVVILDAEKTNLDTIIFASIVLPEHDQDKLDAFASMVQTIPQILECHRMSGSTDYVLKIVTKNIKDYDALYKQLIKKVPFLKVSSNFVLEKIKQTSELPIL